MTKKSMILAVILIFAVFIAAVSFSYLPNKVSLPQDSAGQPEQLLNQAINREPDNTGTLDNNEDKYEGEVIESDGGWKQYINREWGISFKFKDNDGQTVIESNPNYIYLRRESDSYLYLLSEFFAEDGDDNLRECIEQIHQDKGRAYGEGAAEDITSIQEVRNSRDVNLFKVATQNEYLNAPRIKYYLGYGDIANKYNKDYILIQYVAESPSPEKEEQFSQVIDTVEFIQ